MGKRSEREQEKIGELSMEYQNVQESTPKRETTGEGPGSKNKMFLRRIEELTKTAEAFQENWLKEVANDSDSDDPEADLTIGTMSAHEFASFVENYPQLKLRLWRQLGGKVKFFGLPSVSHELVSPYLAVEIGIALHAAEVDEELYLQTGSPLINIGNQSKEPDYAFFAENRQCRSSTSQGKPFPTVVFEVSVHHESLATLKEELKLWVCDESDAVVAYGIKVMRRQKNGTRNIFLLTKRKDQEIVQVNIGEGFPDHMLEIKVSDLFAGVPLPGKLRDDDVVSIDCRVLRCKLLREVNRKKQ